MKLALFDLDHTLIPFDSGMAWTKFLVQRGFLDVGAEARYLGYCHQYVQGTLNIREMHRACLQPLIAVPAAELDGWLRAFEQAMAPGIAPARLALVEKHQRAGDLCVIVTATERLIAEPFARLFGVQHLVATEAERVDGVLTGEINGEPCYRELKVTRVAQWLAQRGTALDGFTESWFYSDSSSDLPLLQAVTRAVAVDPDARLREWALTAGWPVLLPG